MGITNDLYCMRKMIWKLYKHVIIICNMNGNISTFNKKQERHVRVRETKNYLDIIYRSKRLLLLHNTEACITLAITPNIYKPRQYFFLMWLLSKYLLFLKLWMNLSLVESWLEYEKTIVICLFKVGNSQSSSSSCHVS
jgi:hypothetical protein